MIDLVNNIKNKPIRFPRDINNIGEVTEDVIRRMLTVDPNKRVEWENLFTHPIVSFLENKLKQDLEESMKQTEDMELNASKFYLKANMVVDHPKEIEKKENINTYAYDMVYKKKQPADFPKKKHSSREKEREKAPMESTKETLYSTQHGQFEGDKN